MAGLADLGTTDSIEVAAAPAATDSIEAGVGLGSATIAPAGSVAADLGFATIAQAAVGLVADTESPATAGLTDSAVAGLIARPHLECLAVLVLVYDPC